jgi:hypothetical protein
MQTRFRPSLETLGERLNLSAATPVDLDVIVYSGRELSVDREGEYSWAYLVKRVLASSPATLEGHECLVFYLGGIPSSDAALQYWVFGTELPPDATEQLRHRAFAVVDRTQFVVWPLADLTSSQSVDESASVRRRNHVTTHSFDLDRPGSAAEVQDRVGPFYQFTSSRLQPSAAADGTRYKPLFAALILELDNAQVPPDDLVGWDFAPSAGSAAGPSVLLQRLANPSIPYEGAHVLYQDVFIPAAEPIALARDPQSSGM